MQTDSATKKHDVSTFAGAVGGSVGVLSVLAVGLCISIRVRRRRARVRERRRRLPIAEPITSWDHGEEGDGDEATAEERNFGVVRNTGEPVMAQASPAPFVPRYFPGSVPASPPPYNAAAPLVSVENSSPFTFSLSRAGLPVSVPSTIAPTISSPAPAFSLYRTGSNNSYADRPPPTPSSEEARLAFGTDDLEGERTGGIIGPLPPDSPVADETDPMLGDDREHEDGPREAYRDEEDELVERRPRFTAGRSSSLRSTLSYAHSSGSWSAGPSNSGSSDRQFRRASSFSYTSTNLTSASSESESSSRSEMKRPSLVTQTPTHTLSNSTSLPALTAPTPTRPFSSPSSTDLLKRGMVSYPLLQPSRVPLPYSTAASTNVSQETLARHDSRT